MNPETLQDWQKAKQKSRERDAQALASGEKSREQLWRENSFIPVELAEAPLDFAEYKPLRMY
jgi:hypothetical protein